MDARESKRAPDQERFLEDDKFKIAEKSVMFDVVDWSAFRANQRDPELKKSLYVARTQPRVIQH
jgi:hypothetical protein